MARKKQLTAAEIAAQNEAMEAAQIQQAFEQGKYQYALAFRFSPDGNDYFVINSRLMKELVKYLEKEGEDVY